MKYDEFSQWDKIFAQRDEYAKNNPELETLKRFKTFKDIDGQIRCSKCGATEDIGNCPECQEEKQYLKLKS